MHDRRPIMRVGAATLLAIGAIAALVAIGVTDQILPAADPRTISMRPWIAARAMGVTAYLLLALEVALGLVLSHPRNTAEWRKTKQVFPWHEMVTVFTGAFLALHVALLATDPYADVGVIGALVPGLLRLPAGRRRPRVDRAVRAHLHGADRQVDPAAAVGLVAQGPPVRGRRLLRHLDARGPGRHRRRRPPAAVPAHRDPDPRGRRPPLVDREGPPGAPRRGRNANQALTERPDRGARVTEDL